MGEVVAFPVLATGQCSKSTAPLQNDPYYRFIRNVLVTANACGFTLPLTIESAAEHVYLKTRDSSELARLLREKLK
jgi:hypothetical protein